MRGEATVEALLNHADVMAASAREVHPSAGHDPAPYMLLQALATELTLKALLLSHKGRYPKVHSLRALLGDLPAEALERVLKLHFDLYRAVAPEAERTDADRMLWHVADASGDAFQMARYPDIGVAGIPDPEPLRRAVRAAL
jgi:HEPN domain-containing protein